MKGQFILLLYLAFTVKNTRVFTGSEDGILVHSHNHDNEYTNFSTHALIQLRTQVGKLRSLPRQTKITFPRKTSAILLILLGGDIHSNPGPRPPKFPCGICKKAVKWDPKSPSVCCDSCDIWFHQRCMAMPDVVFEGLKNVSWECVQCGLPNFSTSLFNTTIIDSSNPFDSLTSPEADNSSLLNFSFSAPTATSSPKGAPPLNSHGSISANSSSANKAKRNDIPLRVLVMNCQSARKKKPQIESIVDATEPDIVIGVESWLDSGVTSNSVFPDGYTVYRRDRPDDVGWGGVFILVSSKFQSSQPERLQLRTSSEMLWVEIKVCGSKSLYVCAFYKPPKITQPGAFSDLEECLGKIPGDAHVWVTGDFNLPHIDWDSNSVRPYAYHGTLCQELLNLSSSWSLEQVVRGPTRITENCSSLTELFFTNNPSLINTSRVIPGISDHEAVFVESSLRPFFQKTPNRETYVYKKANFQAIRDSLRDFRQPFIDRSANLTVNELWLFFKNKITSLMKEHIPTKTIRNDRRRKPWITPHIRTLRRKLTYLFKKCGRSPDPSTRQKYLKAKAAVQREQRQAYWSYVNNLLDPPVEDADHPASNQKRFWSYIKSLRKDQTGIAPLRENGQLYSAPKDKANILNNQYKSVFTREDTTNIPTPSGKPTPDMAEIIVTEEGVRRLLVKTNPHKASGPDQIPARILKECAEELTPILTIFFQKTLDEGQLPDDWKRANVSAVYKKGDRHCAANYRPVSLTSICCKIQEHIITSCLMKHLNQHNILVDNQHGFRAKRSCETQLVTLIHEIAANLESGTQTDLIILDFSKAFDKVPHERLLCKLAHYGIKGRTYTWIREFLSNRLQEVIVDGSVSDPAPVISGVPQGTVLGPILFLIFINDLPANLTSRSRLFADDCIVYNRIRNRTDQENLQRDLDRLAEWEGRWGMEFHPQKCNILTCTRSLKPKRFTYKLRGHALEHETSSKYLGVDITTDLSWDTHINRITKKASRMLGFIRRNLLVANKTTKTNAYFSLVRPHLEYCCSIWNPHEIGQIKQLESIQRQAARYVCRDYSRTSSVTALLNQLSWDTLACRRTRIQLTLLYKIIHNEVDIQADPYLTLGYSRTRSNHSYKYRQYQPRTQCFKFSFFPRVIPVWNALPASVVEAPSLVQFKKGLMHTSF